MGGTHLLSPTSIAIRPAHIGAARLGLRPMSPQPRILILGGPGHESRMAVANSDLK